MASSSSAPLIEMEASQPPAPPAEPPLVFPFASQADVIRAEQKDAYVKYTLREMVKDVYGSVFGRYSVTLPSSTIGAFWYSNSS
jgi:hypothetical protein